MAKEKHRKRPDMAARRKSLRAKTPGLSPGSLVYTGPLRNTAPQGRLIRYGADHLDEWPLDPAALPDLDAGSILWLDIHGIHDVDLIERLGARYRIHALATEDIVHPGQRPKYDEYEGGGFISLLSLRYPSAEESLDSEQVTIFFNEQLVASFQEDSGDLFARVRERLLKEGSRLRTRDSAYLVYALLDLIVDNYFLTLEELETRINRMETRILELRDSSGKEMLYDLRNEMLLLRKALLPLRDLIYKFSKQADPAEPGGNYVFFRDLYDHVVQAADTLEVYRDMVNGLNDLYLSQIGFRTNAVIQLLTIISTIFIPITFIVGVYGMNFRVMPELDWAYGYPAVWAVMIGTVACMLLYFRKKGWL